MTTDVVYGHKDGLALTRFFASLPYSVFADLNCDLVSAEAGAGSEGQDVRWIMCAVALARKRNRRVIARHQEVLHGFLQTPAFKSLPVAEFNMIEFHVRRAPVPQRAGVRT